MQKHLLLYTLFLIGTPLVAQPAIQWQKCLGGNNNDDSYSIKPTSDGGYITVGFALSNNNGDVMGVHGGGDFWVVKLDGLGVIEWSKALGGNSTEVAYEVQETSDGGYVVAGKTFSNNGNVSGNHGELDYWVVKLNNLGNIMWQRTFGGSNNDEGNSIHQTNDGGYIIAGNSISIDGDITHNNGGNDFWIAKISQFGDLEWEKTYGGLDSDVAYFIRQISDGNYIVCGETHSTNGDVSGNHGDGDYWVIKIDQTGNLLWQKALGGIGIDGAYSVQETQDKGFIVVGTTGSGNTGQVTGVHGGFDIWVVKLDSIGTLQWQKALGGSDEDYGNVVRQLANGYYVIAGTTSSINGNVLGNDGGQDIWIVVLNESGFIKYQKTLGGTEPEWVYSLEPTSGYGLILSGYTRSNDGDVSGFHGLTDFWVVKLSLPFTAVASPLAHPLEIYPNPALQSITLNLPTDASSLSVCISDVLGRSMLRQTGMLAEAGGISLEVSGLPAGVYLVSAMNADGQVFSGRFTKE